MRQNDDFLTNRTYKGAATTVLIALIILITLFTARTGLAQEKKTILRLHGSNTIGAELAPDLAEAFLKKIGAESVSREVVIPGVEVNVAGKFPSKKNQT
ncbi:MAG: hypothetical protein D3914_07685, partial [Candidatus Electrothrix sp. LOE2]|nr:hypothetical protein [Candidatus Electrothrix sp. LOE2]